MLQTEPTKYTVQAAGTALNSAAWSRRKQEKRTVSAREKTAKRTVEEARALACAFDSLLDRYVERIERILRRDGAADLLAKLDQVIPEREPVELGKR